ncbi:MAG TPA: dTMP kinase [Candidatus Limnocylindrales bacterium]
MGDRDRSAGRGWFVTLEGPEGAGKTVVAERLRVVLDARGVHVCSTREPGGTPLGERIRTILLEHLPDDAPLDPWTDALLFNAARAQLVRQVIRPALDRGDVVLCARFTDSTLAYQGFGAGLPLDDLRALNAIATGGLEPDLTILLDLPVESGLARKAAGEQTRFESGFDLSFHRRIRGGFLALAADSPRFVVVDATAPLEEVVDLATAAVEAIVTGSGELSGAAMRIHR